ncbi:membrane zinc metalloprotease [Thalassotalea insulae]|uniref:Membrane zinc metalloprotease n=1 Tax=Thalassotalea insulae TaxID=2056778 RepID=A0ABQ6GM47_9GAMM|nr:M50 family metallopeptidase [Thalassotalea insulae]GLX77073.1 membrane zinc metalloprotease [Thalassotalea insulae]
MSDITTSETMKFSEKYRFAIVLIMAAFIMQIPYLSIPLKWFESYFHEMSHGLAALATGGSIVSIQLFPNGAGLCTTRGGSSFVISFFGYAGASLWGMIIYRVAAMHQRMAQLFSGIIALVIIITMVFWLADWLTFVILSVLLTIVLLKFKLKNLNYFQWLLQIIAAVVLLNSVKSPLYLIDGRMLGDGASLAQLTLIPEIIWVAIWCALGMLAIWTLMKTKI